MTHKLTEPLGFHLWARATFFGLPGSAKQQIVEWWTTGTRWMGDGWGEWYCIHPEMNWTIKMHFRISLSKCISRSCSQTTTTWLKHLLEAPHLTAHHNIFVKSCKYFKLCCNIYFVLEMKKLFHSLSTWQLLNGTHASTVIWAHLSRSGSQSEHRIRFILLACGFSNIHEINIEQLFTEVEVAEVNIHH